MARGCSSRLIIHLVSSLGLGRENHEACVCVLETVIFRYRSMSQEQWNWYGAGHARPKDQLSMDGRIRGRRKQVEVAKAMLLLQCNSRVNLASQKQRRPSSRHSINRPPVSVKRACSVVLPGRARATSGLSFPLRTAELVSGFCVPTDPPLLDKWSIITANSGHSPTSVYNTMQLSKLVGSTEHRCYGLQLPLSAALDLPVPHLMICCARTRAANCTPVKR